MTGRVLILGASARAAAASARRAGLAPVTIDLFADADTRALAAEAHRCDPADYPAGLVAIALSLPPTPWLYTGGLENHPALIEAVSRRHTLLGNGPDVLAKVRNRAWLRAAVAAVPGAAMPDALAPDEPTPAAGDWLWRPPGGAGGAGVRASPPRETGGQRERFLPGPVQSVTYVSTARACRLVGTATQWAGEPWLHARRFAYCGNAGPVELPPAIRHTLDALGTALTAAAALTGTWGLDFIATPAGVAVLELNPRITAAVDVFDASHATAAQLTPHTQTSPESPPTKVGGSPAPDSLVAAHVRACESGALPNSPPSSPIMYKAVYYAPHDLTFPDVDLDPAYADRPAPGTPVPAGHPVLTLLARDVASLRRHAAELDRLFHAAEAPPCPR